MKKPGVFDEAIEFLKYDAVDAERCSCSKEYGHRQKARELRAAIRVLRVAERWTKDDDGFDHEGEMWKAIENASRVAEKGGKK